MRRGRYVPGPQRLLAALALKGLIDMAQTTREARGYGRKVLSTTSKGKPWKYEHEFEHRGSGIVAIYSYGPAGEHEALVREAARVMRDRFGVSGAVSSGGCSGGGHYAKADGTASNPDWRKHTEETQTIFCIDAVAGKNRPRIKQCAPSQADWHLNYRLDWDGQDYAADGDVDVYLTGPLEDETDFWTEKIQEWCGDSVVEIEEITLRAVQQGRYWFLADGDPVVEYRSRG